MIKIMLISLLAATAQAATTTNNNESCDISVTPAATLLLPYFAVDTTSASGTNTLFTVTNHSRYPQIAHVTVWTDWGYPVLGFNLFLTGYDVQGISLYDVIAGGVIVPGGGTNIATAPGSATNVPFPPGATPLSNTSNPNFVTSGERSVSINCAGLPSVIPADLAAAVKSVLRSGIGYDYSGQHCPVFAQLGFNHGTIAVGYVTIDVVSYCTTQFPSDAGGSYFAGPTAPILFDNVLSGDYQVIGPSPSGFGTVAGFDAQGESMVHIHAVPEGGLSGAGGSVPIATNLPFTFYDRYTPLFARTADRRQPLPSVWSARYIQGGAASFVTDLKIWREGITNGGASCVNPTFQINSTIRITDIVRFDEHENSVGLVITNCTSTCTVPPPNLPATSRTGSTGPVFPPLIGNDLGGWLYLDLNNGALVGFTDACRAALSAQRAGFGNCGGAAPLGSSGSRTTSQNWVVVSMFGTAGANRLAVDFNGVALGNGCTPAPPPRSNIVPATQRNGLVCPENALPSNCAPGTFPPPVNP